MMIDEFAAHFEVNKKGDGYQGRCSAHDSTGGNSLTINPGDDGRILVKCFGGCSTEQIVQSAGLSVSDLFPPRDDYRQSSVTQSKTTELPTGTRYETAGAAISSLYVPGAVQAETWTYRNTDGNGVAVVVRFNKPDGSKEFRPVSVHGGGWYVKSPPEPRLLYRLDELADSDVVYVTEGEKPCDAAWSIGLFATTSMGGANAPQKTDWSPMAGRKVRILPDCDVPGEKFARSVSELCYAAGAESVTVIALPGQSVGDDIVEWIERHGDAAEPDSMREEIEDIASLFSAEDRINPTVEKENLLPHAIIKRMSDVQPVALEWLWCGRFPLGKLSLIAGDPGLGKSFLTMDIAARVSRGDRWPDDQMERSTPGSVMIFNSEDDIADTIRPRLDAAGADPDKIYFVEGIVSYDPQTKQKRSRGFSLDLDLPYLAKWLETTADARLIIIDPISAYCGKTDSHNNADVRGMLSPLVELAARHGVAVLCVTHLAKGSGGKAVYRAMGSLAFAAAARAVWSVNRDLDNPERRLLLPAKMNLCRETNGLGYSIVDGCIHWEESPVQMTADDFLTNEAAKSTESPSVKSARDEAIDWLRDALADGPRPAKELLADAKENGHTEKTVRRAFKQIGGTPHKSGFDGCWTWGLPDEDGQRTHEDSQDSHSLSEGTLASWGASSSRLVEQKG